MHPHNHASIHAFKAVLHRLWRRLGGLAYRRYRNASLGRRPTSRPMRLEGQGRSELLAQRFHLGLAWHCPFTEHSHLQCWAERVEPGHVSLHRGLDNEMQVTWHSIRMGPEAYVDLLRLDDLRHCCGHSLQQRTQRRTLDHVQLGDMEHVPHRLDHQRPQAERTHRVLDDPTRRLRQTTSGKRTGPDKKIARETPSDRFHSSHPPGIRAQSPPGIRTGWRFPESAHPSGPRNLRSRRQSYATADER